MTQPASLLTLPLFLLSGIPLAVLGLMILWAKKPLLLAGIASSLTAFTLSYLFFGAPKTLLTYAVGKGAAFTAFIAFLLMAATLFYSTVQELGVVAAMGQRLRFLGSKPMLQVLVVAWCFAGFMEGIVGFGIPVVLVAPLLIVCGHKPFLAVAMTLVGHAWAVTYGTLGVPFFTLSLASRLPADQLSLWLAAQLGLAATLSGFAVAHIFRGIEGVRRSTLHILAAGAAMTATMYILSILGVPQLTSLLSGLTGIAVLAIIEHFLDRFSETVPQTACVVEEQTDIPILYAFAPYLFLLLSVILFQVSSLRLILVRYGVTFSFPETATALGFLVPAEPSFVSFTLRHSGFAILLTTFFAYLLFRRTGHYTRNFPRHVLTGVLRQAANTTATLFFLVTTAMLMNDSGMTTILAMGTSRATAAFYPILVPYVGILGTFLTGSNTNSNLLFGLFQHQIALNLGITPSLLAAGHSAAASVASSVSPAKILIAVTAIGLKNEERRLLVKTLPYCLLIALALGILTLILSYAGL